MSTYSTIIRLQLSNHSIVIRISYRKGGNKCPEMNLYVIAISFIKIL